MNCLMLFPLGFPLKKVPHLSVDRLLATLREKDFSVPASCKTLLQQMPINISAMEGGQYFHCDDWPLHLTNFLSFNSFNGSGINICLNIDGLCLFNPLGSSKYHAYPILLKILDLPSKIFCIGIYCASNHEDQSMPHPAILLNKYFDDFDKITRSGVNVGGKIIKIHLRALICDAPVSSALKNIIGHTGYNSCERCNIHGSRDGMTQMFLSQDSPMRTDQSFFDRTDEEHHKSQNHNILETHHFRMVSGFVLDVMHLCYLGVTKRIATF